MKSCPADCPGKILSGRINGHPYTRLHVSHARSHCSLSLVLGTALAAASALAQTPPAPASPHAMTLDDIFRFQDVGDPQVSPDGHWVAYTLSHIDTDRRQAHHRHLDGELGRLPGYRADLQHRVVRRAVPAGAPMENTCHSRPTARVRRRAPRYGYWIAAAVRPGSSPM